MFFDARRTGTGSPLFALAIALILTFAVSPEAQTRPEDGPHLAEPKNVAAEVLRRTPRYEVILDVEGDYAPELKHVRFQLYSVALGKWGKWHRIEADDGKSTVLQKIEEAPGFYQVGNARVHAANAAGRLARVQLRVLGENGSVFEFSRARPIDDDVLDFTAKEVRLDYCCPEWSTSCQCTGLIDCIDMQLSAHCGGQIEWGSCAGNPGETCGVCSNMGGNCGDSPGCGEENPCSDFP